jgi:lysyl-tRNA synthetase class 2
LIPHRFAHTHYSATLREQFEHLSDGEESGVAASVAGRVMLLRTQGKLAFATLRDSTGEIQLFALAAVTVEFDAFTRLHLGDWVGVHRHDRAAGPSAASSRSGRALRAARRGPSQLR